MLTCAYGAEKIVKQTIDAEGWRLAFSRPGFVTAKHDEVASPPKGVFIRTSSTTIGHARSAEGNTLIEDLKRQLSENKLAGRKFDQLHVWPKDRAAIGRFGFEPGVDEVSKAVSEAVFQELKKDWLQTDQVNRVAEAGDRILDLVLVEPSHWFFGWHTADQWPTRWPGGVQPINPKYEPISRAYYKAAEAITWSGFDIRPNDLAVEIGSAPGGASGRLLELGCRVLGIDPAEMDERIAKHPKFKHIRARAGDLPRREFRGAKWLLVDSNVRPDQTLVTVGNVVNNRQTEFKGLLITMKIGDYKHADLIRKWTRTVQAWDVSKLEIRQLARNRCEVCFAVTM